MLPEFLGALREAFAPRSPRLQPIGDRRRRIVQGAPKTKQHLQRIVDDNLAVRLFWKRAQRGAAHEHRRGGHSSVCFADQLCKIEIAADVGNPEVAQISTVFADLDSGGNGQADVGASPDGLNLPAELVGVDPIVVGLADRDELTGRALEQVALVPDEAAILRPSDERDPAVPAGVGFDRFGTTVGARIVSDEDFHRPGEILRKNPVETLTNVPLLIVAGDADGDGGRLFGCRVVLDVTHPPASHSETGTMMNVLRLPLRAAASAAVPLALRNSGKTFADSVLQLIARARATSISEPAIDYSRYPEGVAPYGPFAALIVSRFIRANREAVDRTAALFADEASRDLLRQLFAFRAVGPHHLRLPTRPSFEDDAAAATEDRLGDSDIPGLPSGLFAIDFEGSKIEAEATLGSILQGVYGRQYFFERNGVRIAVESGDAVIDAGGCFGDTALIMAGAAGPAGQVYSFEPVPDQIVVFERNLARNPDLAPRIRIVRKAVSSESGKKVAFSRMGAGSRESAKGEIEVETLSIDDLVEGEGLQRVDFIKMDIEGAETRALNGAARTIRRFRPKLGISVYHSVSDLIFLPQLVKEIEPSYRLYLEHHSVHAEETVLYAVAEERA